MSVSAVPTHVPLAAERAQRVELDRTRFLVPVGRTLFAAIFILAAPGHFSHASAEHAAAAGLPFANVLVPASGVLSLLGGLSVLTGFRARWGAALLALFLLPVTFAMHAFWAAPDPQTAQVQLVMFLKNVALIGASLLIVHFGAGPGSVDDRQGKH
jgi:putative oxidoreductase